ncbi:hypothetical protein MP638_000748 [Amoeboaphelidium occidentale]|nr:hypothetical protein MP638_000748 [Amoeboaphelidium occidentale]
MLIEVLLFNALIYLCSCTIWTNKDLSNRRIVQTNMYGRNRAEGWGVRDGETHLCPDGTLVTDLLITVDGGPVADIELWCSDGSRVDVNTHYTASSTTKVLLSARAAGFKALQIRSGYNIDKICDASGIRCAGQDAGEGPYGMAGDRDDCFLQGFQVWIRDGFIRQIGAQFSCAA